jgi:phosphopentomutase
MDGVGVGELPDAADYGDRGANTVAHVAESQSLSIPFLARLGLAKLVPQLGSTDAASGAFGKMSERSPGKDSTTGHWEMAGVILEQAFRTYPDGFPVPVIAEFEERIGRQILGNRPASGTVIIQELGEEHRETGKPIVYTSADSVFQIAAHEEVIPLEELYKMCRVAFELVVKDYGVARIIARPFIGDKAGSFVRTPRRRDFVLKPPRPTLLDRMAERGLRTFGVGKIEDIFAGSGVSEAVHTDNNSHGVAETMKTSISSTGTGTTRRDSPAPSRSSIAACPH